MNDVLNKLTTTRKQAENNEAGDDAGGATDDLSALLTKRELESFATTFIGAVSQQAFGSLPKRELDLLIFHQLTKAKKCKDFTTYDWANLLRISEGRVRTLRADASLRFEKMDHKDALVEIAKKFGHPEKTGVEFSKGSERVKMLLDEPALQREFEYAIRKLGRIPDYTFNRNVLDVPVTTFVAVFLANFPDHQEAFAKAFKKIMDQDKDLQPFLDQNKSLGEQFEAAWAKHKGKREALTEVATGIAAVIAA